MPLGANQYYMVFQDRDNLLPGAVSMSQFVKLMKELLKGKKTEVNF